MFHLIFVSAIQIYKDSYNVLDYCVYQSPFQDMFISADDNYTWTLLTIKDINVDTVFDECLQTELRKRAILDWHLRLGSQTMSAKYVWNVSLQGGQALYQISPNSDSEMWSIKSNYIQIKSADVRLGDYYIRVADNYSFRIIHIRCCYQPGVLNTTNLVTQTKIAFNKIILTTEKLYEWRVYFQDPSIQSYFYYYAKNTNSIAINLTNFWNDKVFIVSCLLIDSFGKQYYSVDWSHQVGQQWGWMNCSQTQITFSYRYYCLEWSSNELNVLLPDYSLIINKQYPSCVFGQIQTNVEVPFCVCFANYYGQFCNQTSIQNQTAFSLLLDLNQTKMDNYTYLRVVYLLIREYNINASVIYSLQNQTGHDNQDLRFLILDSLAVRSILNNDSTLAQFIFQKLIKQANLGAVQYMDFTQFAIQTLTQSKMKQINNLTSLSIIKDNGNVTCSFLKLKFIYGQILLLSKSFSAQLDKVYAQITRCIAFDAQFNQIIMAINMTIPTLQRVSSIANPAKLICNQTLCRLLQLTDDAAFIYWNSSNDTIAIKTNTVNRTFNPDLILDQITSPSSSVMIYIMIYLIF